MVAVSLNTGSVFIGDTALYDTYYFSTNTETTTIMGNRPLSSEEKKLSTKATPKAHLQSLRSELEKRDRRRR